MRVCLFVLARRVKWKTLKELCCAVYCRNKGCWEQAKWNERTHPPPHNRKLLLWPFAFTKPPPPPPPSVTEIFMDEVTQSTFCYVVPNGSDDNDDVPDENKSKWQNGKHFDRVIIYGVLSRESKRRGVRDGPRARLADQRPVHTTVCQH